MRPGPCAKSHEHFLHHHDGHRRHYRGVRSARERSSGRVKLTKRASLSQGDERPATSLSRLFRSRSSAPMLFFDVGGSTKNKHTHRPTARVCSLSSVGQSIGLGSENWSAAYVPTVAGSSPAVSTSFLKTDARTHPPTRATSAGGRPRPPATTRAPGSDAPPPVCCLFLYHACTSPPLCSNRRSDAVCDSPN